jgi:mycothiol synthase
VSQLDSPLAIRNSQFSQEAITMTASQQPQTDVTLRPPTWDDVPALVDLINDCTAEELGLRATTAEEFRVAWEDPGFDFATHACVAVAANGTIAGYGAVYCSTPYVRNFLNVHVHPTQRGRGIGTLLSDWGEQRVGEHLPLAPADARVTIQCGAPSTFAPALTFLRERGYSHIRSFYQMKIEMENPPPTPTWPAGITVRSMIANQEEEAVYRADIDAFRDHWGFVEQPFEEDFARWLHYTRQHPYYDPAFYFLALDGDEIAGLALCAPKDPEYPQMAWVNTLAVRRPWRRQGLALALLHHSFGEFYRRGIRQVGLGVDAGSLTGATRLYEKAGMHVFRQFDAYAKELRPGRDLTTQQVGD